MASATMRAAEVVVGPVTAGPELESTIDEQGRVSLRGWVHGPGWDGEDTFRRNHAISRSFFLTPDLMPVTGSIFSSLPVARLTGDLQASTGTYKTFLGIIPTDYPSSICVLELSQYVFARGEIITSSYKRVPLVEIRDSAGKIVVLERTPADFLFEPTTFRLDRGSTLAIHLLLNFKMTLEGQASLFFNFVPFTSRLGVGLPEWTINSLD
jgi:hypothetical protein